jgi:hypothetical protein
MLNFNPVLDHWFSKGNNCVEDDDIQISTNDALIESRCINCMLKDRKLRLSFYSIPFANDSI